MLSDHVRHWRLLVLLTMSLEQRWLAGLTVCLGARPGVARAVVVAGVDTPEHHALAAALGDGERLHAGGHPWPRPIPPE